MRNLPLPICLVEASCSLIMLAINRQEKIWKGSFNQTANARKIQECMTPSLCMECKSERASVYLKITLTRKWLILQSSVSISRISSMSTSIASVWGRVKGKWISQFSLVFAIFDNFETKRHDGYWWIKLTGGSNSFWSSSYSHISTAKRFRIKLIWCDPYLAVRNFSRRSLTASPFSVKLTRRFVRLGDRSQSLSDSSPHCILCGFCLFSVPGSFCKPMVSMSQCVAQESRWVELIVSR